MRPTPSRRATAVLVLTCGLVAVACTKSRSTEPANHERAPLGEPIADAPLASADSPSSAAPVGSGGAPAGLSHNAAAPTHHERELARGFADLEVAGQGSGDVQQRDPAKELAAQVGKLSGRSASPAPLAQRSFVVLKSHDVLQPAKADRTKILLHYFDRGQKLVKQCYERLRARDPGATGMMTLRFTVTAGGDVTDAEAESWSEPLSQCVQAAAESWTIPAQRTQVRIELVLKFQVG